MDARTSVPTGWMMVGCGVGAKVGARPAQGAATTTDVDLRVECGWGVRRLRGGLPAHVDVYYAGVSL